MLDGGDGSSPVVNMRIDITQDGTRITNSTRNVIVGQQINLGIQVAPTTVMITGQRWTVPGSPIANYVAGSTSGLVYQLTNFTSNALTFYWYKGGESTPITNEVTYSGTANGRVAPQ